MDRAKVHHFVVRSVGRPISTDCGLCGVLWWCAVPWFPTRVADLDLYCHRVLDAGADLQADHPGFHDKEYRARRKMIAERADALTV